MIRVAVLHASLSTARLDSFVQYFQHFVPYGFSFDYVTSLTKSQLNAGYDLGIVIEHKKATDTGSGVGASLVPYNAGDKPVLFIGGQNRGGLPADFPIIAFNSADADTYYQVETGLVNSERMNRVGSRVIFKDGRGFWGTFASYMWGSEYGYYRVDLSKLNENVEVLAWLDAPKMRIAPPPANHAVAVRYYNRYFLPILGYDVTPWRLGHSFGYLKRMNGLGMLLYALSHAGIKPEKKTKAYWEIDHPLGVSGYSGYTQEQRLSNLYKTLTWLVDTFKNKGLNIVCGITTNHTRDATWGHVKLYNDFELGRKIHQLLRDNPSLFSVCWHDHSFDLGTTGQSYTRHSGGSYGVPANITDPECPFGTGSTATVNLRSLMPLLVHIEDQKRWMVDYLGFPGIWAEPHFHLNCASNSYGGRAVVSLLHNLYGLRSVRVLPYQSNIVTGQGTSYTDPAYPLNAQRGSWGDVIPIFSEDVLLQETTMAGLDTRYALGASGDRDRIYRRYMAMTVGFILNLYLAFGVPYFHEASITDASLSDPLGRYYATGNFNGWVELFSEVDEMISVLKDWIEWGTVSDVRSLKERASYAA